MDNPLEQIRKLERRELHAILFSFVGLISPGVLAIWQHQPSLIPEAGFGSLILLSLSATFPVALVNYFFLNVNKEEGVSSDFADFLMGVGAIGISAGCIILLNLFAGMSLRSFIVLTALSNFLLVYMLRKSRPPNKQPKPTP